MPFRFPSLKLPLARAQNSTTALPYCATAFFTTQQVTAHTRVMRTPETLTKQWRGLFSEHNLDAEPHHPD